MLYLFCKKEFVIVLSGILYVRFNFVWLFVNKSIDFLLLCFLLLKGFASWNGNVLIKETEIGWNWDHLLSAMRSASSVISFWKENTRIRLKLWNWGLLSLNKHECRILFWNWQRYLTYFSIGSLYLRNIGTIDWTAAIDVRNWDLDEMIFCLQTSFNKTNAKF